MGIFQAFEDSLVHLKLFIFGPLLVKLPLYLLGFCGS